MDRTGAERTPSGTAMGVVIAAFAIGILTGAAGLVVAVLLSAP
jgi:hypothetical protein